MKSRLVWCQPGPGAMATARPGCHLRTYAPAGSLGSAFAGLRRGAGRSRIAAGANRKERPTISALPCPVLPPSAVLLAGRTLSRPARRGPLRSPPRLRLAWGGDCPARKYSAPSDIGLFKCARMLPESENELPESALFRPARSPGRNQRIVGKYASNELSS